MAQTWGLKGNLGLAKLEKGKVLLEFEMVIEAKKALNLGGILVGRTFLQLEKWSPKTGCLMEGEKKNEAWVRIVGLSISLWDWAILRKVGEKCGGFLAIDSQMEKLEELQWARILVKLNGEEIPSVMEIGVEGVCYSLTLWWEVRPIMRLLPIEKRGKNSRAEGEVEGDVSARAGKRVLEEVDDSRIETHLQSGDGTRGQTGGSGLHLAQSWGLVGSSVGAQEGLQLIGEPIKLGLSEALRSSDLGSGPVGLDPVLSPAPKAGSSSTGPSSLEGSRRVKALEAFGAPGPARMDDCRGPSQSLVGSFGVALPLVWAGPSPLRGPDAKSFPLWVKDGQRKQIEEELYSVERSRTGIVLIEEASRYGCTLNPCGLLASGFSSSPSFFFGRTPLGIATFLGTIGRLPRGKPHYACSSLWDP